MKNICKQIFILLCYYALLLAGSVLFCSLFLPPPNSVNEILLVPVFFSGGPFIVLLFLLKIHFLVSACILICIFIFNFIINFKLKNKIWYYAWPLIWVGSGMVSFLILAVLYCE